MHDAPDDLLAEMAAASASRADAARARAGELRALAAAGPPARPIARSAFGVIAEVKRASPSEGVLADARRAPASDDAAAFVGAQAVRYASAGASAVSVLTEPMRFGGDLTHLEAAARAVAAPVMRKDFLVDPVQLVEARAAGASGALLIARMLDDGALAAMLDEASALGLWVLIEAFDGEDLDRTGGLIEGRRGEPEVLVGVNTRDLRTLRVDPDRLASLADRCPAGARRVAESGIHDAAGAAEAARLGYDLALVGTALMRCDDPGTLCRAMIEAGRGA